MLGRKSFTRQEIDRAQTSIEQQLTAYRKLAEAAGPDPALGAFEPLFVANLVLALDRPFVHRVRMVTGKETNPLNELELLGDGLMDNGGIMPSSTVIKHVPEQSVLGLAPGDRIALDVTQFEALAKAVFAELEKKYLEA